MADAAIGEPLERVFRIVNEQTRESVENPATRALRESAIVGVANHTVLIAKDGTQRPIDHSAAPIRLNDESIGCVLVFRDMTDRRRQAEELRQIAAALSDADRRKDVFLATLGHELRNPLAPIRTAARILSSPQLAPEKLQWVQQVIQRQVTHMAILVEDLLDLSRITQGKLKLRKDCSPLTDIVDSAVETARPLLDAKRHRLQVRLPDEPLHLRVDPFRLAQVLSNLLANAAKYTDPGGDICLHAHIDESTLHIAVTDSGVGIPAEALPRLFTMFSQLDASSAHSEGGLGIGLALVKGLIELHGGTIDARSEGLGQGSEFTVHLPLGRAPAPAANQKVSAPSVIASRRRVLVVDDNKDAADSLAMLLELGEHEVRVAHDGCTALSLAQSFRPDVALLDIGLPGLNGYEVARELRRESWGASIRLIALTGWCQEDDRRRARKYGPSSGLRLSR